MKALSFIALGGAAGFAWYSLVGCGSGGCPIWSNPYLSTLIGGAFGWSFSGGSKAAD